jgi:hypothetical protein
MEQIIMQILTFLSPVADAYVGNLGWAVAFLSYVATARLLLKPTMTWLHSITEATETKKDNEALEKVEQSSIYKTIIFVLDWIASIKIAKK